LRLESSQCHSGLTIGHRHVELARAGKTLEAIKRYWALTDASLDQAKDAVAKAAAGGI
jgi:ribosomal protein L7/L12